MADKPNKITFTGATGETLAARLDLPLAPPRAFALFAHCFTCSKDILVASRIAAGLAERGIAVLRFDFTGLGQSDGEFANTDFSSNVGDILAAVEWLRQNYEAPKLLVGHSLGGAAILAAAGDVPEAVAVATIGAPAHADHVIHNFAADLDRIEADGEATVTLAGRQFQIRKEFLDNLRGQALLDRVKTMGKALMVLHAPRDDTVGVENASEIFLAAKHPKSFVSLDDADHLVTKRRDAEYAAGAIAALAERYIGETEKNAKKGDPAVALIEETGFGKFQQSVIVGRHQLTADEPERVGGLDTGPTPYDFLSVALGACTSMTLRMYAERKKLALDKVAVSVTHGKVHAADCEGCDDAVKGRDGKIDRFERSIRISGDFDEATASRLLEIADLCPVHKTLEAGAAVVTKRAD